MISTSALVFEVHLPEQLLQPLICAPENICKFELKPFLSNESTLSDNLSGIMTVIEVPEWHNTRDHPLQTLEINTTSLKNEARKRPIVSPAKHFPSQSKRLSQPTTLNAPSNAKKISDRSLFEQNDHFAECFVNGDKFFMCTLCAYKSNLKGNILRHLAVKHSDNPPVFKCSSCSSSFKEKSKLKGHYMKAHNLQEHVAKASADAS